MTYLPGILASFIGISLAAATALGVVAAVENNTAAPVESSEVRYGR